MALDDADLRAELQALLAAGQKLEAVRRYREATGCDLLTARQAVEALESQPAPSDAAGEDSAAAELVALLEAGRKIEAIKLYRKQTGADLKDAKDAIDRLAADRRIAVPSGPGCLGMVLLVAALILLTTL
jgi:ribosomal protein L7/L12